MSERSRRGYTPLHFACSVASGVPQALRDDVQCASLLVTAGAAVNAADAEGSTPLHRACRYGLAAVVAFLLSVPGVDAGAANNTGVTPAMEAAQNDRQECLTLVAAAAPGSECCSGASGAARGSAREGTGVAVGGVTVDDVSRVVAWLLDEKLRPVSSALQRLETRLDRLESMLEGKIKHTAATAECADKG